MRKIIIVFTMCFLLQGCIPLLVGTAVYGISKNQQNKTERLKTYNMYRIEMEKLNIDRETKGLEPVEVESYEAWNFRYSE